MGNLLTIVVAAILGLLTGAVAGQLTIHFFFASAQMPEKLLAGGVGGAAIGMIAGSIAGELSREGKPSHFRKLLGLFVGLAAGLAGASQSHHLGDVMNSINFRIGI